MGKDNLTGQKNSQLNSIVLARSQFWSQMSLAWVLRNESGTIAVCRASQPKQIEDNVRALNHLEFSSEELIKIDQIVM